MIIEEEQHQEIQVRPVLWLSIAVAVLAVGGTGIYLLVRMLATPEPELLAKKAVTKAEVSAAAERHREVVETLKDHLATLADIEDVDALRLFAASSLKVPLNNNRHLGMASEVYRRICLIDKTDLEATRRLTEIFSSTGKTSDAIKFARRSIKLAPNNTDWQLELAELLVQDRDFDKALNIIDSVLKETPHNRKALQQRISTMLAMSASDESIVAFADGYSNQHNDLGLRDELRLMHAQAVGNQDVLDILQGRVATAVPTDAEHAEWLAQSAIAQGDMLAGTRLLEQFSTEVDDTKPIMFRYLNQNKFDQVRTLLAAENTENDAEILTIRFFCDWLSGTGELQQTIDQLQTIDTQFARTWHPVLQQLQKNDSPSKLLKVTQDGLEIYPGSPWLYLIKSRALTAIQETELAVQSLRIAIKANPQWGQARIELANLLLQTGDPATAFGEAAAAIRTCPESPVGYEIAMLSALELLNTNSSLSDPAKQALLTTIETVQETAIDEFSQDLFKATAARVGGEQEIANQIVKSALVNESLLMNQLNLLALLTTDNVDQQAIDDRMTELRGVSLRQLVDQAAEIAGSSNISQSLNYLKDFRNNGSPLSELTIQLVLAEVLATSDPEQANVELASVAAKYSNNVRLLSGIIGNLIVRENFELRRKLVNWLKEATSEDALKWQWEEIRLQLDEDESEKLAAALVLRINNLLKQSPSSSDGYELMAIAMERLDRPDKVIKVLQAAISAGIERSSFRLRLAELLLANGENKEAAEQARIAGTAEIDSIRQRAASVLLAVSEFESALNILQPDVPEQLKDSDSDYALASVYAIASANLDDASSIMNQIAPLAQSTDRWFRLWLDVCCVPEIADEQALEWLAAAKNWESSTAFRIRRLAGAWKKIASRTQQPEHWITAKRILESLPESDISPQDRIILGGLCEKSGDQKEAQAIYRSMIEAETPDAIRAIALNNLSLIESREGKFKVAEQRIEEAIQLSPRPEFFDSLATIYMDQKKRAKAISVLEKSQDNWPESTKLKERLSQLRRSTNQ